MDWQSWRSWRPLGSSVLSSLQRGGGGSSAQGCQSGLTAVRALKSPARTGIQPAASAAVHSLESSASQAAESSRAWAAEGGAVGRREDASAAGEQVEEGGGR